MKWFEGTKVVSYLKCEESNLQYTHVYISKEIFYILKFKIWLKNNLIPNLKNDMILVFNF